VLITIRLNEWVHLYEVKKKKACQGKKTKVLGGKERKKKLIEVRLAVFGTVSPSSAVLGMDVRILYLGWHRGR